jgi:peptidoglycan/LPS O-acetylase OafA/YrhL
MTRMQHLKVLEVRPPRDFLSLIDAVQGRLAMQPLPVASIDYPRSAATQAGRDISHRPDLDGLRALAAVSVLAFHSMYQTVPGGGQGVDMFFVLSGFLISGIILRALIAESFSFSDFYARRIRRIFPALIVVLLTVWIVGSLILLPDEYRRLGKDVATSAVFSLYIFWGLETNLSFDMDVGGNLLSQLWSLGVEEQYYLLWPLFLLILYKIQTQPRKTLSCGRGHCGRRRHRFCALGDGRSAPSEPGYCTLEGFV